MDHVPWKRRIHFHQIGVITTDIHTLTPKGRERRDRDTHMGKANIAFVLVVSMNLNFAKHKGALKSIELSPYHEGTHTPKQHKGAHFNHCFSWKFFCYTKLVFYEFSLKLKRFFQEWMRRTKAIYAHNRNGSLLSNWFESISLTGAWQLFFNHHRHFHRGFQTVVPDDW